MELVSKTEHELLKQLRERIKDLNKPEDELQDKFLIKWLRARKLNLNAAEIMIRNNQDWKKRIDLDGVMTSEYPPEWGTQFPWHFCGFDDAGCSVAVVKAGLWDLRLAMEKGQKEEYLNYIIKELELVYRVLKKGAEGRAYVPQFIAIYDFKGLSWSQVTSYDVMDCIIKTARTYDSNYPEQLNRIFLVNTPMAFKVLWRILGPILEERTYRKFTLLGGDVDSWREEISKVVPLSQFPLMYGGTGDDNLKMTADADGNCHIKKSNCQHFLNSNPLGKTL